MATRRGWRPAVRFSESNERSTLLRLNSFVPHALASPRVTHDPMRPDVVVYRERPHFTCFVRAL